MTTTPSSEESMNNAFITWFKSSGGSVNSDVGLTTFPLMGRGAVALHDIQKGTILFSLPRSLTLSTRTSPLPSIFGAQEWNKYDLHKGWVGLILCMMWEEAAGTDGNWSGYLSILPNSFQTPMFWDDDDLHELMGTSIYDKIGKTEAEEAFHSKLLPAIKSRPDLFPPLLLESHYTLHKYHIMGSRILSRSFHVEKWASDDEESTANQRHASGSRSSDAMDIDGAAPPPDEETPEEVEEEASGSDGEDEDDPTDVAMVPLADILNARYGSENAKLCHEPEDLQMISTRDIRAGDQILNTYGDPSNSDLLRCYGHVDCIPMEDGLEGNPADIVDIRADLIVDVIQTQTETTLMERIEWWLDECGDDIFTLESDFNLPEGLVSLIRLLIMPFPEWLATRDKGKVPKPKFDPSILRVAETVLEKRLAMYKTTAEEDKKLLLLTPSFLDSNKRMAVVVRLGEKRILKGALDALKAKDAGADERGGGKKKRKERDNSDTPGSGKKARQ